MGEPKIHFTLYLELVHSDWDVCSGCDVRACEGGRAGGRAGWVAAELPSAFWAATTRRSFMPPHTQVRAWSAFLVQNCVRDRYALVNTEGD